jgi:hypothetical protein
VCVVPTSIIHLTKSPCAILQKRVSHYVYWINDNSVFRPSKRGISSA